MLIISRVLCPVDRSDISKRALRYAFRLARQHGARLRVLHVVEPGLLVGDSDGASVAAPADALAAAEEDIGWLVASVVDTEVEMDTVVRDGPAARTILREARDYGASVIVAGTHGRGGFERLALGSVTEKLLRKASCPVLVVPPGETADMPVSTHRVICPTDFSAPATAALDYARVMAAATGAALSIVTVVEWPFGETTGDDAVATLRRSLEAEAASQLTAASAAGGPPTETAVLLGKPWKEIVAFARAQHAGLIVMGVAGRGAIDLAVLGSTTHHVVREAPCPVLVVPDRIATERRV
jgi:nucleotide-binding universal stress UspA family protein